MSKFLPADPKMKIAGHNNRLLFILVNATFFAPIEIFLAQTPTFVRVYPSIWASSEQLTSELGVVHVD